MHTAYWGITRSPFVSNLNPVDYFPGAIHEEALARLHFLIDNHRSLGYLMGASGTGKSLILEVVARQLRRANYQVLKFNTVGLEAPEFVWRLATGLGHVLPVQASIAECWRGITDRLIANRYQRISTVILLDDVDNAGLELQSAICRLALIDPHAEARTTIVMALQRPHVSSLMPKLNDLCELRIDLEPWDVQETGEYIQYALDQVGAKRALFTPEGIDHLFELTHGVPRRVRQLAELSLLAGAAEEAFEISADVIDSVFRSLTRDGVAEAA